MRISFFSVILISTLLVVAIGCGGGDGRVKVYPVHGKVLVKGQPASNARVVFYSAAPATPNQKNPTPAGNTDANGEFRLESYQADDGAPAGEYRVTIVWPEPPPPSFQGMFDAKDRLRGRYSNPETSKLTAKVESGGGEIPPFDLQWQGATEQ
jgi:hypothetical protein